jgi:hypothetical protein
MFGDALLPSECSLIIEELKETSLCFQVERLNSRLLLCYSVVAMLNRNTLAVCSWAPDHSAHREHSIPPRRVGEAQSAKWKADRDLAWLGAPRTQPGARSNTPQTTEKATPWAVIVQQQ